MTHGPSKSSDFTIILPTYNEAENIGSMIEALATSYPEAKILVMDDNSTDQTAKRANASQYAQGRVQVIVRNPMDRGLSASVMEGIMSVGTKYFIVLDADFQHPPRYVQAIMDSLLEGHDMTVGVREDKMSMLFSRKFASAGAHLLARSYLWTKGKKRSSDTMSGFFGGRAQLCRDIIQQHGDKFERRGFKIFFDLLKFAPRDINLGEIIYQFEARQSGESKLNPNIILSIMRQCGLLGRVAASVTTFFIMTVVGRFLAAIILGLLASLLVILFTGAMDQSFFFDTFLSLVSTIALMVLFNELIASYSRRSSIALGLTVVVLAFLTYLLNLSMYQLVEQDVPMMCLVASFLGFVVAFSYDSIGTRIPRPHPSKP